MTIDVVIDTETTGLCDKSQVISIGYCFRNPENDQIISSNVMIKPDIERMLSQDNYQEALEINKLTLEEIKEHPVSFHDAVKFVKRDLIQKRSENRMGFNNEFRFLAYNKDFDYRMLARLPDSKWFTDRMPSRLFAEELCGHSDIVIPHGVDITSKIENLSQRLGKHRIMSQDLGDCQSETACIMLRASERWGHWSEYHQSYRWLSLVDAYYAALREINERNDTFWTDYEICVNGNRYLATTFIDNAHDSGADAIMALIVHETLQEASK